MIELVKTHLKLVLVTLVVAAVLIGAAWGWSSMRDAKARKATAMLSKAVRIYQKPVLDIDLSKVKKSADGIPHFKDRKSKLTAAEKAFSEVVDKYGQSGAGAIALAMRGGVRYDLGQYKTAIEDLEKYLARQENGPFRAVVQEDLIYSYEATKQYDKALALLDKLPAENDEQKELMAYHKARLLALKGQTKKAVEQFREIVSKTKSSQLRRRVNQRLALMGAKK